MKKKLFILTLLFISLFSLTACTNNKEALAFKKEYEQLNGKENATGKKHRTLNIPKDNPYEKVSQEKIIEKLENNDTFYLYVGDSLCPWCRSVLEKSIEVAKTKKINKIYYIDIWDEEGNEILRDKYEIKDGKATKVTDGTKAYKKLLKAFDKVLSDYTLADENGNKIEVGEKRIYAPNFFYIKNGKVVKLVEGISDKQKDSREELTDEILADEENIFSEFFSNWWKTSHLSDVFIRQNKIP